MKKKLFIVTRKLVEMFEMSRSVICMNLYNKIKSFLTNLAPDRILIGAIRIRTIHGKVGWWGKGLGKRRA